MARRLRTVGRVAALAALAVLMSACLKLDIDLTVSSDDTVSGSVVFAMDKGLLELAGQSFEDAMAGSEPFPQDIEGVTVEDYEDDEFVGQRVTFEAVPISEFSDTGEGQLSIVREGDVFRVTGVLDLSVLGGATGPTGFDPSQFLEGAELQVRMTFPGEVTESNGQIDGSSVTWVPELGESTTIQATASAVGGDDSNLVLWLIIGGVALLVVIVAVVILMQRRKPAGAPLAEGEAPVAPAAGAVAAPAAEPMTPPSEPMTPPSEPPAPPSSPAPPPPPPPGSGDEGSS